MSRLTLNPQQRKLLNELLRPIAVDLRAILLTGQGNLGAVMTFVGELQAAIQADPSIGDAPIDDGRDGEGVRAVTAAELATGIGFMLELLAWTQEPANTPKGDAALKIAPFPFRARPE